MPGPPRVRSNTCAPSAGTLLASTRATATQASSSEEHRTTAAANGADASAADNGSREATATSTQERFLIFTRCSFVYDNAHTFVFVQFRAGRLHELHDPLVRHLFVAQTRAGYFHAFVACPPVSSFTRLRHRHQHQPGPLRDGAAPGENQKIDVDAVVWRMVCDIATAFRSRSCRSPSRCQKTLVATRHADPLLLGWPLRLLSCSSFLGSAQEPCTGVPQHGHLPSDRRGSQQTYHTSSVFSVTASPVSPNGTMH